MLYRRLFGEPLPYARWSLGRFGVPINAVGFLFELLVTIMSFFPLFSKVTAYVLDLLAAPKNENADQVQDHDELGDCYVWWRCPDMCSLLRSSRSEGVRRTGRTCEERVGRGDESDGTKQCRYWLALQ